MDDALLRQLTRQLKILNLWISIVGTLILASIIVCIILLVKVFTFVHHVETQITDVQQKTSQNLDLKQKLCDSSSFSGLLQNKTNVCQ